MKIHLKLLYGLIIFFGASKSSGQDMNPYTLVDNWLPIEGDTIPGRPAAVGIGSDNNIFVFHRAGREWTDPMPESKISKRTIMKLEASTGKIIDQWGENLFIMPHGIEIDPDNNMWVVDVALHQVLKFNMTGTLLFSIGEARVPGNDSAHFNRPTDVAFGSDGTFYVSDGYINSRIVKYSSKGKYIKEWGSKGKGNGQFDIPHGIDIDKEGNVYVADRQNKRIQTFDKEGNFLKSWGDDSFGRIFSVAVDKKNNLLVASDVIETKEHARGETRLIQINLKTGAIKMTKRVPGVYHDIGTDKDGNIFGADTLNKLIHKYTLN